MQELSNSTPTANLLSGGIDELFVRTDSTGTFTPLEDALGSTIALVNANGNLVTQYSYDPFGNTTVSGASNSNAFQYTGRENEANGLYNYRARYYSPRLHRFISQDPLGFAGSGLNPYDYLFDNPTIFRDPTGTSRECPVPRLCAGYSPPPSMPTPDYVTVGLSLGWWSPSWTYVPSSDNRYGTLGAGGVSVMPLGIYANTGYINQPGVDPDGFVQGMGGSVCAHFVLGVCETAAPAGSGVWPLNTATEIGIGTPNFGGSLGYTNLWGRPRCPPQDPGPGTQIPLGDGLTWTTETPWDNGPGTTNP
ncbi:MAG: RHS repeat-associated core domain-containing protein [Acidobacteriia bacterium]|nr:RHS repeat-associated core domain-containing protein [Terriglobia bacterium]